MVSMVMDCTRSKKVCPCSTPKLQPCSPTDHLQPNLRTGIRAHPNLHRPTPPRPLPPERGGGGSRAGVEATGQRTGESTRDENSRANDGNRYQDVKLKTEQASDYHAMVPKSHGEIPKSCTKNLPATPIVTAPTKRA